MIYGSAWADKARNLSHLPVAAATAAPACNTAELAPSCHWRIISKLDINKSASCVFMFIDSRVRTCANDALAWALLIIPLALDIA
jgi:hypothetical protein